MSKRYASCGQIVLVVVFLLAELPVLAEVTAPFPGWIEPGTIVERSPPQNWSHVILVAYTRVGAGDVQEAPSMAVDIARRFSVAILANVGSKQQAGGTEFFLDRVGIGIGTRINGKNTVISSSTHAALGAGLGLIERQVLSTTERDFVTGNRLVARTATMMVFDADVMLLVGGEHRPMVTRYALLVVRDTGQVGVLSWVLEPTATGDYRLFSRPMQYLQIPVIEDRVLNVKADRFFLGVPWSNAFAQVSPTTGQDIRWTDSLRRFGVQRTFSANGIHEFESELWKLWGR